MAGLAATGTKLSHSENGTTYTEVVGLQEVPELGGAPEKIDTTTLKDTMKTSVAGIQDPGDLTFKFLYNLDDYKAAKLLEGKVGKFQVEFPDGLKMKFDAEPTVIFGGAAVNGALSFSIAMALATEITPEYPTAGA